MAPIFFALALTCRLFGAADSPLVPRRAEPEVEAAPSSPTRPPLAPPPDVRDRDGPWLPGAPTAPDEPPATAPPPASPPPVEGASPAPSPNSLPTEGPREAVPTAPLRSESSEPAAGPASTAPEQAAAPREGHEERAGDVTLHLPSVVHDGQLLVAQLRSETTTPITQVTWQGVSFRPHQGSNGWMHVLLPVSLHVKIGPQKLTVDCGGKKVVFDVPVTAGAFPESRLTVDPKFTAPPPPRVVPEREAITAAFSKSAAQKLWSAGFAKPAAGVETSPFGVRRTFNGALKGRHMGEDFDGKVGDPLWAANDGVVALAAEDFFFVGNAVFIDHGEKLFTMYFHMTRMLVKTGDRVTRGQQIGFLGSTGRVTGPHVHFAVKLANTYVDPAGLLAYSP